MACFRAAALIVRCVAPCTRSGRLLFRTPPAISRRCSSVFSARESGNQRCCCPTVLSSLRVLFATVNTNQIMRSVSAALAAVLLALALHTPADAQVQRGRASTTTVVPLRARPAPRAPTVGSVPRGQTVQVARCAEGWCQVRYGRTSGYAQQRFLRDERPSLSLPPGIGPGYLDRNGQGRPSPSPSQDGRVPRGATARCKDGSYSQSRSRRGTCSQHGGVKDWLN